MHDAHTQYIMHSVWTVACYLSAQNDLLAFIQRRHPNQGSEDVYQKVASNGYINHADNVQIENTQ